MDDATLVIGAGPAGLATARALAARGLPYDHVERHDGVGGIWDIDAPGSPMYEAAHFISSRTLSGFPGFPMGEDLPDYPDHRQVLAYLRAFATAYRLADRVETGRCVERVERDGPGYRVTLDGGEVRRATARWSAAAARSGRRGCPTSPTRSPARSGTASSTATWTSCAAGGCWSSGAATPPATSSSTPPEPPSAR